MIENIELQELESKESGDKNILTKRDISICDHVTTPAEIMVCSIDITIEQLFKLKVGSVISSSETIDSPMTLVVNGKPIAKGNLVVIDDKFGFEVTAIDD